MSSTTSLQNLAGETVEHIISLVDDPCDLLYFALANKTFHKIIVPNHLEFRTIRCDPYREDLWSILLQHPRLTGQIRNLELVSEMGPSPCQPVIVPRSLGIEAGEESLEWDYEPWIKALKQFQKAIMLMPRLKRFCWQVGEPREGTELEKVFAFIKESCHDFCELELDYSDSLGEQLEFTSKTFGNSIWNLSNLTKVSFYIPSCSDYDYADAMQDMIVNRCPTLIDLRIAFGPAIYDDQGKVPFTRIFEEATWPHLRRLTLDEHILVVGNDDDWAYDSEDDLAEDDLDVEEDAKMLSEFFKRHPTLEAIQLSPIAFVCPIRIQPGSLPALKFFYPVLLHSAPKSFTIAPSVGGRIEHFSLHVYPDKTPNVIVSIIKSMPGLKTLAVLSLELETFKMIVPHLRMLQRIALFPETYVGTGSQDKVIPDFLPLLRLLPKLTHIAGPQIFHVGNNCKLPKGETELLDSMPSVKFVEAEKKYAGQEWLMVHRSGVGAVSKLEPVTNTNGLCWKDWGNFFRGILPRIPGGEGDHDY